MVANKTNYIKNGINYYRLVATYGKKPDGKPNKKEFHGKSFKEAKAKKDEYDAGLNNGLNIDYKNMTLGELIKLWLFEVVRVSNSDATFDRYESIYRNYIEKTELNNLILSVIRPLSLQMHYNNMADQGNSESVIFNLNKVLKVFFNYALVQGYILKNPCFKIALPKSIKAEVSKTKGIDPLSDEEIKKIEGFLTKDFKMIYLLALGTGLRRGELLGLSFEDVDIDNKQINVVKALGYVKKIEHDGTYKYVTELKNLKTKNSKRMVPIPGGLILTLKAYI